MGGAMSSVTISGDTSGSIILQAPAVSGSTTLTLPTTTGTLVTSNAMPTGSVLQVVQASTTTRVASSSNSYADTGLSVSITPLFSTSRILIIGHQADCFKSNADSTNSIYLRLLRNSTEVLLFADRNLLTASAGQEMMATLPFHYLDSPATTSATTYKTQFRNTNSVNLVSVQQQSSSSSIIIAM